MIRKWINGYELVKRWGIKTIDYLDHLKSGLLKPYSSLELIPQKQINYFIGRALRDLRVLEGRLSAESNKIYEWQYKREDIEEI